MRTAAFLKERTRYILLTAGVFIVNYAADRITKILAVNFLKGSGAHEYLGGCFVLYYAENEGAFLSMGAGWNPWIKYFALLIIPIAFCLGIIVYLLFREKQVYRVVLLASIAGGGIGNLLDRLLNNFRVIDFLNFGIGNLRTGILNVADISVTFGVIILLIIEIYNERKSTQKRPHGKR
jgi:signal peptidase II